MRATRRSRWVSVGPRICLVGLVVGGLSSCKQDPAPLSTARGRLGKDGASVPPVEDVLCERSFVFARLSWRPATSYDEIQIYRGDDPVAALPGSVEQFTDCLLRKGEPFCGYYEYRIYGLIGDSASDPATAELGVGTLSWIPNREPDLAGYRIYFSIARKEEIFSSSPNPYILARDGVNEAGISLLDLFTDPAFLQAVEEAYGISTAPDPAGATFPQDLASFLESGQLYLRVTALDTSGNESPPSEARPFRYRVQQITAPPDRG